MSEYYAIAYSNSLSHHGVKGMKWGVRKDRYVEGAKRLYKMSTSRRDRHKYMDRKGRKKYSRAYEKRFSKADTLHKAVRTGVAVSTFGLGKPLMRFQANHKKGFLIASALLSAPAFLGGPASAAAIGIGKHVIRTAISNEVNDILYNEIYNEDYGMSVGNRKKNK